MSFISDDNIRYFSSSAFFRNIFKDGLDAWLELIETTAGPLTPSFRERLLNNDIDALRAVVANDRPDISKVLPTMTMPCRLFAGSEGFYYSNAKRAASELTNGDFIPLFGLNHCQLMHFKTIFPITPPAAASPDRYIRMVTII